MEAQRNGLFFVTAPVALLLISAGMSVAIVSRETFRSPAIRQESIGVFDLQVDKRRRAFVDIVFDRPVPTASTGSVVAPPPAKVSPALAGVWRWQAENILRFSPAGGFGIGTDYTIALNTQRFVGPGERFRGDNELKLRIDKLMVDKVVTSQEPGPDPKSVIVRGEIHFNYTVDPAMVVTHTALIDGQEQRPIEVLDGYGGNVVGFRTQPVARRERERVVRLLIRKGLAQATRGAKLENDHLTDISIGSSTRLTVHDARAHSGEKESTLRIELSSTVDAEIAPKFIAISPPVKYRASLQANEIVLSGAFAPGTSYQLTVAKGLPGLAGELLEYPYSTTVAFSDLEPRLDFQSQGTFLSASGYKTLAIESVNAGSAVLAIDRVYRNNIFYLLSNSYWYSSHRYHHYYDDEGDAEDGEEDVDLRVGAVSPTMGDPIVRKKLPIRNVPNRKVVTTVSLDPYIKSHEPGLYRVVLAGHAPIYQQTRWILITDLGVVAKRGDDHLFVWISSFKDLHAVSGATVTMLSDQNQVLGSGVTDSRGIWEMRGLAKALAKKRPFMLTVKKGSDFSFLIFGKTEIDLSPFDVSGDKLAKDGYSAFVYGERDIYRPGETVRGLAVVRNASLDVPPQMPLVVKHHDSDSERGSFRISVDENGVAPLQLDLPVYARTGRHRLDLIAGKVVIGTYNFQVEEFVPDRIRVDIKAKKPHAAPGDDLVHDVTSNYLFGPPAAGLTVETRVRLTPVTFARPGYESYSFSNPERKFDVREISTESGVLDAGGSRSFQTSIPAGLKPPSGLQAVITSRVQEQGGRGVAAVAHVPVHAWPYYIGLRRTTGDEHVPGPGESVGFEWIALTPDGKETKSGTLRAELYEDEWHSILRRNHNGSYDYASTRETHVAASKTIAPATGGKFAFVPASYRTYRVVVSDPQSGASAQVEFYAGGWGYSPWAMKNPGRLQLALDKDEYAPGENATLQVKSPFSGKLLVTIERDDVYYTTTETLETNTASISLPVSALLRPNAYVTATVVRAAGDLEPGEAGRAFGAIPIQVDRQANRLRPEIQAPADLRSQRALPIAVTAEPGSIVTIAAVDEGILQLIAQRTADPHSYFYRKLALGVATSDIFAELLPEVKPRRTSAAGGSESLEGLAQYVRADSIRRARPVAFWSGPIKAGADGKARVRFDIPDFQGGVRIMAVVHNGRRFGSAETMTRVHDPLVLLPTFPRFLSVGDELSIPVSVRNDTGRDGRFTIAAVVTTANGPQVKKELVDVPKGAEKTVYLPVKAPALPGEMKIDLTASGNGESAKASSSIGVRWDRPLESVEQTGRFSEEAALFRNEIVAEFVPGSVDRTLVISPLPIVQFRGKLSYLLNYPYGCVEQTTSSVFPLIYFSDLARELDPEAFKRGNPAALVAAGIRRLGMMQTHEGGFSMWPHGGTSEPWGSVYATHFLVEARRAGHSVPQTMLDRALGYVAADARARGDYDTFALQRAVYALYILARAGKSDVGTMDYIREHHQSRLEPQARGLLAAAYAAAGNPKMLDQLTAGIADVDNVARHTGGNFDSSIRNRALLLLALLDGAPDDARIPALVERLTRDAFDRFWSTQESALVLVALGQLARTQHAKGSYAGTVYVDDSKVGDFTAKTTAFRNIKGTSIRVEMHGPYNAGAAYYSLTTRGVRTDATFRTTAAGISIRRELFTRDGAPVDPANIQQGELLVCAVTVQTTNGAMQNVVVQNLIPAGLEVENPRLKSSESFSWMTGTMSETTNVDIRDDQVVLFTDLPDAAPVRFFTLLRAVTPGTFQQPPVYAEAMYSRSNHAIGERDRVIVRQR